MPLNFELGAKQLDQLVATVSIDFEPNRLTKRAAAQLTRERAALIGFFFVHPEIAIASNTKLRELSNLTAGEKRCEL